MQRAPARDYLGDQPDARIQSRTRAKKVAEVSPNGDITTSDGTGRPKRTIKAPVEKWNNYFDADAIAKAKEEARKEAHAKAKKAKAEAKAMEAAATPKK